MDRHKKRRPRAMIPELKSEIRRPNAEVRSSRTCRSARGGWGVGWLVLGVGLTLRQLGFTLACLAFALAPALAQTPAPGENNFSFAITCDMRQYVGPAPKGKRYFDGACEALQRIGPGAFMIVPGDCDPIPPVRATLDRYLGSNYVWYPVAGNHEADTRQDMAWLRRWASNGIPNLVRSGPAGAEATMYAFDYANSHFVALNDYFNGKSDTGARGDVATAALDWLAHDLAATKQPLIWVIGHAPIESQPDMDNGRVRHDSGDLMARPKHGEPFVSLLKQYHVRAYLCGHTHNTSAVKVRGLWQVDAGHARGAGDKGAASTFLKIRVTGTQAWLDIFRADKNGQNYQLKHTVELD